MSAYSYEILKNQILKVYKLVIVFTNYIQEVFHYIGRVALTYGLQLDLFLPHTCADCLLNILVTHPSLHTRVDIVCSYLPIHEFSTANFYGFDASLYR